MSNAFNSFNQPKPTGISFNQPSTNAFNQQNYGLGLNQSHNGNIFGQSNTGNGIFQNQSNNGFFQSQNAFGSTPANTNPFPGTNAFVNNSIPAYQNYGGQGNNLYPNFSNIIRNAISPFSHLGIKPSDSEISEYLLSYI